MLRVLDLCGLVSLVETLEEARTGDNIPQGQIKIFRRKEKPCD